MFKSIILAATFALAVLSNSAQASPQVAQRTTTPDAVIDPALKQAVASWIRQRNPDLEGVPSIAAARLGNTPYYVVYLRYRQWCGSGGCHPDIYKRTGNTFEWAGELAVSRLPIRMVASRSGKLPSIAIAANAKTANGFTTEYGVVSNDGKGWSKRWPSATTTQPVGAVLISGDHFEPLW